MVARQEIVAKLDYYVSCSELPLFLVTTNCGYILTGSNFSVRLTTGDFIVFKKMALKMAACELTDCVSSLFWLNDMPRYCPIKHASYA